MLPLFKMTSIKTKPLDKKFYPLNNHTVCTDYWMLIFAGIESNHGELWRYFFADSIWQKLDYINLPSYIVNCTLYFTNDRQIVVHGKTSLNGNIYKTFKGDWSEETIKFDKIGKLESNHESNNCEHQIVSIGNALYTVHGSRISLNHLMVYRLDVQTKTWVAVYKSYNSLERTFSGLNLSPKNHILISKNQLHVFPALDHLNKSFDDFTRLYVFKLRTRKWELINTLPDESTLKDTPTTSVDVPRTGYPLARPNHSYVLMQHSTDNQQYAYLMGDDSWETWKLDLQTYRWHLTSIQGPQMMSNVKLSTVITQSGCMYVHRSCRAGNEHSGKGCQCHGWVTNDHMYRTQICPPSTISS